MVQMKKSKYQKVVDFHEKFVPEQFGDKSNINMDLAKFRLELLREELRELETAIEENDIVAAYDAVLDIEYVNIGTAIALGISEIEFDQGFDEVHGSNMSKDVGDLKPVKGPAYYKPDLKSILFLREDRSS